MPSSAKIISYAMNFAKSPLDVASDVAFCHQSQINGNLRNFYDNLAKNTALYGEVLLKFRL